jgi:hypothetical protein
MALKKEIQYQMYLDILDILQKKGFETKTEKDGANTKSSTVFVNGKPSGKVMAVAKPPTSNRESSLYVISAHAKLVVARDAARAKNENFIEGEHRDSCDCLYYYGSREWISVVDKIFLKWRETSPSYLQIVAEIEKLKKKKPTTSEDFAALEKEFSRMAASLSEISEYRDSAELSDECAQYVTDLKADAFEKATKKLAKLKKSKGSGSKYFRETARAYEEILAVFSAIETFEGATAQIAFCKGEAEKYKAYHSATAYKEAAREFETLEDRPETEKFFDFVYRARNYKKISQKFKSIIPYDDSAEMFKKSKQLYKSFRWKILKKIAPFFLIAMVLTFAAILIFAIL